MDLIPRFAFFSLLLLPYQCESAAENCSETQYLLLPDGVYQVESEFRLKSSEKGVRLVHINLVIGNASYDPLELPDVLLPHRWIWANTIYEPMLSLPDDYDILSAGLLNYQVRSMDVKLKDQPSGCLAKLNSACQNLAIDRMLLEKVTSSRSGDILHKTTPEVCVAMVNKAVGNVGYHCCDMYSEDTGPATVRCDQRVDYGDLILERVLFLLYLLISFSFTFYLPALPLLMPHVFSFENEVEKATRLSKPTILETTRCRPIAEGEQDNQKRTGADQRNTEDEASLPTTICGIATTAADASSTITTINTDREETDQNTSNCAENSRKRGLLLSTERYKYSSIRMALILRFAVFAILLLSYQCEAKAEDCSETQCLLLLDGDEPVASEFHFKASQKGVRLVYINLVIGNASYDPLDLPDVFLPHRWVWANTNHEPMLSLPEDYDMLSAGLLNYQVRSIDVKFKDQPSGCLAKLNATCQNVAVGRMLLENVTSSISDDTLHKKAPVVCVEVITTTTTDDSNEHYMSYHCCYVHKEPRTGRAGIWCDEKIDVGNWVAIVHKIFIFLSFFLALFAPALPLALPDYVFSLEDEVERENLLAEQTNIETTGYQCITNAATEGEQDNQWGTGADRSTTEDAAEHIVTSTATDTTTTATANNNNNNNNNVTIQEQTGQNTSNYVANSRDQDVESKFIPVDDSSPMNLSTLLREAVQKFPDVPLSFNIKLAVMFLCVYPCILYVQIGLYHTLKKTSIDEITKKHVLVSGVFSQEFLIASPSATSDLWNSSQFFFTGVTIMTIILIIILVLFSRPKDFFLEGNEVCQVCRFVNTKCSSLNLSLTSGRSLGDEIHLHLKILHHCVWYFLLRYGNILALICDKLLLGCLREEMQQESRRKHILCAGFRLISLIVAVPFIFVGGVLSLLILIVILLILLLYLSPAVTVNLFSLAKMRKRVQKYRCWWGSLLFCYLTVTCTSFSLVLLTNSCLFVSNVVAYVIIGLALNVSIVTPILAFILVLTTNVYLCYAKLQRKYKEVKKMILEKLQELHMNSDGPKGTIRIEIYWFICDRVLPIKSEVCRMLRRMVLVIAFLFLSLSSIVFFGNKYDISTFTTTVSVFFTGSIAPLFLRILTTSDSIIGWEKIKMEREIDEVVKEYRGSRNGEAARQQIAETRV
ncbi:uncharacterized protein LOC122948974 [Acropora millepora]|uniref:uncharacterized protein LOC122948974 n=1 Tax=Acropora millepora TaxID=45264 RepID=UPI001CF51686|nr:uncharacterized protein LOC122948974 [Acropora millepora]